MWCGANQRLSEDGAARAKGERDLGLGRELFRKQSSFQQLCDRAGCRHAGRAGEYCDRFSFIFASAGGVRASAGGVRGELKQPQCVCLRYRAGGP